MKSIILTSIQLCVLVSATNSFIISARPSSRVSNLGIKSSLEGQTNPDDNGSSSSPEQEFLEAQALKGADAVRQMSIEERTKRAMLAEAAEDQMISLMDELDDLLDEQSGMPKREEDREEVVQLARGIKASQEQYRALVNGEKSPVLDALNGFGDGVSGSQ